MNWLYIFLLIHIINYAATFEAKHSNTNLDVSIEIPKPIAPLDSEELDTSYKKPKKLKWQTSGKSKKPSMVDVALEVAAREGIHAMTNLYQNIEPQIAKNGQILDDNHPAALLSKFSAPAEGNERSAMAAFATLTATKAFRRNNKESAVLGRQAQSQKVSFRRTPLEGLCPPRDPPTCMPASQRYRTHDGTCNNRRRLRWGSAQMPFNRFLPPEYGDGVDSIRGSVEGGALSSARFVSLLVHGAKEGEAPLTLMIVQWGQLLDHDMTSTAQPRSINGSVPSCCGSKDFHPLCFPIKVPLDDPWLAPLKVRCLEFLRSAPTQRRDCVLSWREQTNQVTSYIDASPIYSSNAKTSDNARIFRNGLLIYGRGDPADDVCMRGAIAHQCIRSGDGRSGEQPGLLALHHVWVGEHNRIAMELSILNPHWSDEKVYQETRRIIGALFQHITYREFLPIVLGREVCKLFDLELVKTGYYTGYDSNINPSVSNAFAAAAFRFGHSLVQNTYMRCDRNHNFINNNVTLHEEFQQGDIGTAGSLHRLLRGMATQKALKRDEFITPELTNHLFQTPGFPFGLDLAAINIQRGRDHGIAPYTAWRQPCGLSTIDTWEDLSNVVGPESAKRISHAYRNVHDIDLFVGGIAERPVIGGLVGPTFACIIAQQFSNSRKGDRFWYENSGFESSFTPAQLNSLRHVSLSSVLCRALNGGTLQPYVFLPNDVKGNQRVKCGKDALEPIDLRPWQEQDPFLMTNEKIDHNVSLQSTPMPILSTMKEEKGINNRIQNVTMVANVDFIPNSSIGFHRVANMTKIHDKLDMAQKLVVRPSLKPIRGISNKLDKQRLTVKNNLKPTASPLTKRISTTRRTVVIHNVEIELRSANGANKEQTNKKKKTDVQQNSSLASTAQNTILKVAGVVKSQLSAAMGFLSDNNDDEASTKHLSREMNDQPTVSARQTNLTNFSNNITDLVTGIQTETSNRTLKTVISNSERKVKNSIDESTRKLGNGTNTTKDISDDLIPANLTDTTETTSLTGINWISNQNLQSRANNTNVIKNKTLHLSKQMNDQPTVSARQTNLTNFSNNITDLVTGTQTETPNRTLKTVISNSERKVKNSNNESTRKLGNGTNTTKDISEDLTSTNLTDPTETTGKNWTSNLQSRDNNTDVIKNKTLTKSDISTERPELTLNITNNKTTPSKLTITKKELNETVIAKEELTNSKTKSNESTKYTDNSWTAYIKSREQNNGELKPNTALKNSDISTERPNLTLNMTNKKLNENIKKFKIETSQNLQDLHARTQNIENYRNDNDQPIKSTLNNDSGKSDSKSTTKDKKHIPYELNENISTQITNDQNMQYRDNNTDVIKNKTLTKSDISTERPDLRLNITNTETTPTKLTIIKKELNETVIAEEELNNSKTKPNESTKYTDNSWTAYIKSREQTNGELKHNIALTNSDISTERPYLTLNITNKKLNENIKNIKIETSQNLQDLHARTQNIENYRNDNDQSINSTLNNDSGKSDSKVTTKDKKHIPYELKENISRRITNDQNMQYRDNNTDVIKNKTLTKSDISTERPDLTLNIRNNKKTPTKLTITKKELNETVIAKEELTNSKTKPNERTKYTDNSWTAYIKSREQNNGELKHNTALINSDISTEGPNLTFNMTNKKLNENIKNIKIETSQNLQDLHARPQNIENYRNDNDQSVNSTLNNDSGKSDSKATTKDKKHIPYELNENVSRQITNDENMQDTSTIQLDKTNKSTTFESILNEDKLNTEPSDNLKESHDTYKDFQALINSALQDSLGQHKRVHRKTNHKNVHVKSVELHQTNLDFNDKLQTLLRIGKTNEFPENHFTSSELDRTAETYLDENNFTETEGLTVPINTEQTATLRNIELRQFQERPIYNRPQKLTIDTPSQSDQYEIEINIRQTNTKPTKNNANYEDFNSPHKRYDKDRYNQHYDYTNPHQNTPNNDFFTPTTMIPYGTRTKPPTIIYIDEHDERTTTRGPGIFQNILSFATNGLNSIRQQTTSTESPFNQNQNTASRPYHYPKPSSANYLSAQQGQIYPPNQGFPQHGFTQIPPNFNPSGGVPPQGFPHQNIYPPQALPGANSFSTASNIGGVSHASSNAVSTGHFGAIAGSASSSGGDSTFSFNIRPSPRPQLNLMSPASAKPDYELLPQHIRPQFSSTPSHAVPPRPMPSVESYQYPPNKHDPFSSYTRRPPPYFNKKPSNIFDPAYDDIGRSELTIDESVEHDPKVNQTKDNEDFEIDDYDYSDDDDDSFGNILKNDNFVEEQDSGKNDKIDYLKLAEQALSNKTKFNITELDDNFVLPVLRRNDKFVEPKEEDVSSKNLKTVEQKSLGHDILAEDYDELLTARASFLDSKTSYVAQWNKLRKPAETIAFAPIQILTKPERPDNWVIFDAIDEKPLLPVQPDYNTESLVAAEVPMPFQKRKLNRFSTKTPQMTESRDKNFSTETSNYDMTSKLASEQSLEEFTTDAITNEPTTTTVDYSTDELNETTDTKELIIATNETSDLKEDIQNLTNLSTESLNNETDKEQRQNRTDLTNVLLTNSLTESTDELTTLPNLT